MNNLKDYENITETSKNISFRFKVTGAYTNPSHWHEHIELHYFFNTTAKIFCEDETYDAQIGDLVIINRNQMHHNEGAGSFLFHIDLLPFWGKALPEKIMFQNFIRQDETIKEIYSKILEEYETQQEGYETVIRGLTYILLAYLMRNYLQNKTESDRYFRTKNKDQLIEMITRYIAKNYFTTLRTSMLAEKFHLSKQYFCSFFKSQTGQSVTSYINQCRVDKAVVLLKSTNHSITEIANSVGYDDSNYFSRIFKQYMGMSPKQYKLTIAQHKNSEDNQTATI